MCQDIEISASKQKECHRAGSSATHSPWTQC